MTIKERLLLTLEVIGSVIWRGFGVFLFILGGAAGSGAVITGDPFTGILIAWVTLMLGVVGAIGYAIAVTGKVSKSDVARATKDAVQKHIDEKAGK
jgi:hypothetical protein